MVPYLFMIILLECLKKCQNLNCNNMLSIWSLVFICRTVSIKTNGNKLTYFLVSYEKPLKPGSSRCLGIRIPCFWEARRPVASSDPRSRGGRSGQTCLIFHALAVVLLHLEHGRGWNKRGKRRNKFDDLGPKGLVFCGLAGVSACFERFRFQSMSQLSQKDEI